MSKDTNGCLLLGLPTDSFAILEPPNPEFGEIYVVQKRRAADFKASKVVKGSVRLLVRVCLPEPHMITLWSDLAVIFSSP